MNVNNNFNILPWYTSLNKQNGKKWYAYGDVWPLISPNTSILPFQIVVDGDVTSVSTLTLHSVESNKTITTSIRPAIIKESSKSYSILMVHESIASFMEAIPVGQYYATMLINGSKTIYSEIFTCVNNIECFIKITYWNEEPLYYAGGEINYNNDFKYILYVPASIGKPEYTFEEELTTRAGYKFLESQVSNKVYKFTFVAPEFICDAMRLIRLSDYINLQSNGDSYSALTFSYEPSWEDQGNLASVEVEFETDTIIQKLASFNRRQKEGFYNALLTNVNEPMFFDVDTVAQYYKDYTKSLASSDLVEGKLIRELEEYTDAITDSCYIPVDIGSGPARKLKVSGLGSGGAVDLSKYVTIDTQQDVSGLKHFLSGLSVGTSKKKIYEKDGVLYIDADVAITGGLTTFALGTTEVSTIMDGVAVDGTTITKENGVLKVIGGGGSGFDASKMWSLLGAATTEQINKSHLTTALLGYADINSNVASATKLQTPRTIWGQSFDGTANVSGELFGAGGAINIEFTNEVNSYSGDLFLNNRGNGEGGRGTTSHIIMCNNGGNVGIGTNLPSYKLHVNGTAYISNKLYLAENTPVFLRHTHNEYTSGIGYDINGNECMAFGVKNQTTTFKFKVGFDWATFGNNTFANRTDSELEIGKGYVSMSCGHTAQSLKFENINEINCYRGDLCLNYRNSGNVSICYNGGNVAIGMLPSTFRLDVNGTTKSNAFFSKDIRFECDNNGNTANRNSEINCYNNHLYLQYNSTTNLICVAGGGNVGIGITSPSQKLHVDGNILSEGGITCYSSDARAKTIIEELNLSLKQIAESPTIRFKWNGWKIKDDGKTHIGGIAQYVQKLLPECVLDTDDFLNLDYATTAYIYSVQTARHLRKYETKTDKKIRKLEKEIKILKSKLKQLDYEDAKIA